MKTERFYSSMLEDIRGIKLTERQRAQAENGVRISAAIVATLMGVPANDPHAQPPKHAA